jgi:hypothetical protein
VCVIQGGKIFVSCTFKIFVCGGNVRENVATFVFFTSEARVETKYDAVAGWRRSLQRQLSNGVIPSRECS